MVFSAYPDVVNISQMSQMLGISEKFAYQLVREKAIDHFKVGQTYKIPKLCILQYLHILKLS